MPVSGAGKREPEARASIGIQKTRATGRLRALIGEETISSRPHRARDGHRFESPQLHQEVRASGGGFPRGKILRRPTRAKTGRCSPLAPCNAEDHVAVARPRELAVRFTDEAEYFVSEASVYRLLKAHDLITSPAYIVIKAAEEFNDKTTVPNQLWQTDFWYYLSTVLDDFSRFIVAWTAEPQPAEIQKLL